MTAGKHKKRLNYLLIVAAVAIAGKLVYNWLSMVDTAAIQNNNGNKVQMIGHGGVGVQSLFPWQSLPCNTETSIRNAMQSELDGIELDVQITADSVLVLYHDHYLQDATALQGCIGDAMWEDIKHIPFQIGAPFDWFQSERLISLREGIDIMKEREKFPALYIDYHGLNFCNDDVYIQLKQFRRALDRLIQEANIPAEKVYLIAIHEVALHEFKKMESNINLVNEETVDMIAGIEMTKRLGLTHLQAKFDIITKENVQLAHDAGLFVITHRGKTRWGLKKRIETNVDAIQADAIYTLIDLLE